MKTLIIVLSVAITTLIFAGCTGRTAITKGHYTCSMHPQVVSDKPGNCPICGMELVKKETTAAEQTNAMGDMNMHAAASTKPADPPVIKLQYTKLDAEVAEHIKEVLSSYMLIKNALVNSDTAEAKNGAFKLLQVISDFDNSYFPYDQKVEYDKHRNAIKENAKQMIANADTEMQRSNFSEISLRVYELAKVFDAGKKLYYDHCRMAFDKNGAVWLSETTEIKNPYLGSKMMSCGSVEQVID